MTKKAAAKEHKEHQKDLKPLLRHLKADENKLRVMPKKKSAQAVKKTGY